MRLLGEGGYGRCLHCGGDGNWYCIACGGKHTTGQNACKRLLMVADDKPDATVALICGLVGEAMQDNTDAGVANL